MPAMEEGLSSPPLPEGLASKLAQSEGVANNLNLAITPVKIGTATYKNTDVTVPAIFVRLTRLMILGFLS